MPPQKRTKPQGKKPLLIFFPEAIVNELTARAKQEDTDRSKLVRKAVRHFMKTAQS